MLYHCKFSQHRRHIVDNLYVCTFYLSFMEIPSTKTWKMVNKMVASAREGWGYEETKEACTVPGIPTTRTHCTSRMPAVAPRYSQVLSFTSCTMASACVTNVFIDSAAADALPT